MASNWRSGFGVLLVGWLTALGCGVVLAYLMFSSVDQAVQHHTPGAPTAAAPGAAATR